MTNEAPERIYVRYKQWLVGDEVRHAFSTVSTTPMPMSLLSSREIEYVRVDAQSIAPEPDWNTAPEWATHFIYDYSGEWGIWFSEYDVAWEDGFPCIEDIVFTGICQAHEQRKPLPVGVDWRTTLMMRPENCGENENRGNQINER